MDRKPIEAERQGWLGRVERAISRAASATGVDFGYLLKQAQAESGLNPHAKARTSSARGLFQFTDSTWLATLKKHGGALGLDWAAGLIERVGGRLTVRDPQARAAVLALREDPDAAAMMAAAHAEDNADRLEARLGRAVGSAELYLAHFLGAGGAARFLGALAADGAAAAAGVVPRAAAANRRIFYHADGSARSLSEVYALISDKMGGGTGAVLAARQAPSPAGAGGPEAQAYARAAYMTLAELGA